MANLIGAHCVGQQPMGKFPGTKTTYLEALGETAVDFDFAPPELKSEGDEFPYTRHETNQTENETGCSI